MLTREGTVLLVIDMQGNLYRAMNDKENLLENSRKLIRGTVTLGIPVLLTEQIKIGPTIPEIRELAPHVQAIAKESFSCCGEGRFDEALLAVDPKRILVAGIEAHICVYQTVTDLRSRGFDVYLVADAISSRTAQNREIAIQRMTASGAVLTSTEMALFELLQTAKDPKAREIFGIVK